MAITYTFPKDFQVEALRGFTATGGELTKVRVRGAMVDAVRFDEFINGQRLIAIVDGKPELEMAVAEYRAEQEREYAARRADEKARAQTLEGQREALVRAEYNSYDPDAFPGSARWLKNKAHRDALEAFDAAHPEIVAALEAQRRADEKARFDALSDFVKLGS